MVSPLRSGHHPTITLTQTTMTRIQMRKTCSTWGVSAKVPEEYTKCFLYRWQCAISELTDHLRDDAMLPLDHRAEGEPCVCADAKSGIDLPAWHCPFLNHGVGMQRTPCQARAGRPSGNSGKTGTYEKELWAHVSGSHGHVLKAICKKWKLQLGKMESQEMQLTLFNGALAEKERATVPQLGHSTDRRTLKHVREVLSNDEHCIEVLMCFQCACKELAHYGYNKFGHGMQKGVFATATIRKPSWTLLQGSPMMLLKKLGSTTCRPSSTKIISAKPLHLIPT